MNWGHGIAISLGIFIVMILGFVWSATQHRTDLVAEDYYALELAHQVKIDHMRNAREMDTLVSIEMAVGAVLVHFPSEMADGVSGTVTLFRPSDERLDQRYAFDRTQLPTLVLPSTDWRSGAYRLQVDWTDGDGRGYHVEKDILIP